MSIDIPSDVKEFIFAHVDSVELLEVLLFMRERREQWWSSAQVSRDLRNNPKSVEGRLGFLVSIGLLKTNGSEFQYQNDNPELDATIARLGDTYKIRKHSVFELIFSPTKRARSFADAFLFSNKTKTDEDGNG